MLTHGINTPTAKAFIDFFVRFLSDSAQRLGTPCTKRNRRPISEFLPHAFAYRLIGSNIPFDANESRQNFNVAHLFETEVRNDLIGTEPVDFEELCIVCFFLPYPALSSLRITARHGREHKG